jgi:hypothetical protein
MSVKRTLLIPSAIWTVTMIALISGQTYYNYRMAKRHTVALLECQTENAALRTQVQAQKPAGITGGGSLEAEPNATAGTFVLSSGTGSPLLNANTLAQYSTSTNAAQLIFHKENTALAPVATESTEYTATCDELRQLRRSVERLRREVRRLRGARP